MCGSQTPLHDGERAAATRFELCHLKPSRVGVTPALGRDVLRVTFFPLVKLDSVLLKFWLTFSALKILFQDPPPKGVQHSKKVTDEFRIS